MRPNPVHRRSHLIAASPAGQERLRSIRDAENDSLAGPSPSLHRADVAATLRVLDALTAHFRAAVEAARATGPA